MSSRYDDAGHLEVLVKWRNLPDDENTWMRMVELKKQFPASSLEDKLVLRNVGIDIPWMVYTRRQKKQNNLEENKK